MAYSQCIWEWMHDDINVSDERVDSIHGNTQHQLIQSQVEFFFYHSSSPDGLLDLDVTLMKEFYHALVCHPLRPPPFPVRMQLYVWHLEQITRREENVN